MCTAKYPSIERLMQCVREENGRVFWLARPQEHFANEKSFKIWNTRFSGKEAGYLNSRKEGPRWLVCIDSIMLLRYQVVWALRKGEWPRELDHKNRNSIDDRIENLRLANQSQNTANSTLSRSNTSGFKGVRWREKTKKWQAIIRVNYRNIYLGQFSDPADAHEAYMKAAKMHFGEFACSGGTP